MLISRAVVVIKRVAAHNRDQRANMQNTNLFATRDELVLHCLSFFRMSQWRLEQRVDALLSVSSAFEIVCTQTNFVSNGGLVNLINLFFETVAVGNEYNALPLQFSVAKLVTTAMVASENNRREVVRVIQDETF